MIDTGRIIKEVWSNGEKMTVISADIKTQSKSVTPTKETQIVRPDDGNLLSSVEVQPIPSEYVIPQGQITITEQGTFNVAEYDKAVVTAPFDSKFDQLLKGTLTEITAKDLQGATKIKPYFFSNMQNLIQVETSDTINEIGTYAFGNCNNLERVFINNGTQTIGNHCFNATKVLEIHLPPTLTSYGEYLFANALTTEEVNIYYTDLVAYLNINKKPIGKSQKVYMNGEILENLVTPSGYTTIKEYACYANQGIKTAILTDVETISQKAFMNCRSLTNVTIGDKIKVISADGFNGCEALTEIIIDKPCTVASDVPVLANTNAIPSTTIVKVPDELTKSLYQQSTNWNTKTIQVKE